MMMDWFNRVIIAELQKDGRVSLADVSKRAGISRVAVRKRLHKLLDRKVLNVTAGLNVGHLKLDAKLAIIRAEVENYTRLEQLTGLFQNCPRTIFLSAIGASDLISIVLGENLSTLQSVIGVCSVRVHKGVRHSDVQIGDVSIYPSFLPLRIQMDRRAENAPCGAKCGECERLSSGKCFGCPATKFYNGPL